MPLFTYEHQGALHSVKLEHQGDGLYKAEINGQTYTFRATAQTSAHNSATQLTFTDGERVTAHTAAQGQTRFIQLDAQVGGASVTITRHDANRPTRKRGGTGGASSGDLAASMPGQIRDVLVSVGDAVKRGQALVVLEAMKMEIRVASPSDGVVKNIRVAQGDIVERGQVLVELSEKV